MIRTFTRLKAVTGFISFTSAALLSVVALLPCAQSAERIEDNAFLIEEAYNQDRGIVQNIFTFQRKLEGAWDSSFTQEVPMGSMTNQISWTIPVSRTANPAGDQGAGDILINYRYQAIATEQVLAAPRISLVLPTGDYKKGLGNASTGVQVNLPATVIVNDSWVMHLNFGATYLPKGKVNGDIVSPVTKGTYGAGVYYMMTEQFNLMTEFIGQVTETPATANGTVDRTAALTFSPGFRYAFNFAGSQLVLGFAVPMNVSPGGGATDQFYYVSYEHPVGFLM